MARWRERDHPRDERGRFTDSWAGEVSDAIGMARGEHHYERGDRRLVDDLHYDRIAPLIPDLESRWRDRRGDQALSAIYRIQGYHGAPEVVTGEQLDHLIAHEGYIETFRGVNGEDPDARDSGQIERALAQTQQFRHGDEHYPGYGVSGNGTYTTVDVSEARDYSVENRDYAARGPLHDPDDPDFHDRNAPYRWPGLLRMALRPDARVVDRDEIRAWSEQYLDYEGMPPDPDEDPRGAVLADEGRLAAALGYDAIRVRGGESTHADYYVILNRTAVAVEDWVPPTAEPTRPRVRMTAFHLKDMLAVGNEYEVYIEDSGNWMHAVRWTTEDGRPFLVDKDGQWMGVEGEHSFLTRLVKS